MDLTPRGTPRGTAQPGDAEAGSGMRFCSWISPWGCEQGSAVCFLLPSPPGNLLLTRETPSGAALRGGDTSQPQLCSFPSFFWPVQLGSDRRATRHLGNNTTAGLLPQRNLKRQHLRRAQFGQLKIASTSHTGKCRMWSFTLSQLQPGHGALRPPAPQIRP